MHACLQSGSGKLIKSMCRRRRVQPLPSLSGSHSQLSCHCAATACRAANSPPSTYRTNAANGMRRYTCMHPATSRHAALMKSDIRILTGLSHSISGFGKNSILTSLHTTEQYISYSVLFQTTTTIGCGQVEVEGPITPTSKKTGKYCIVNDDIQVHPTVEE